MKKYRILAGLLAAVLIMAVSGCAKPERATVEPETTTYRLVDRTTGPQSLDLQFEWPSINDSNVFVKTVGTEVRDSQSVKVPKATAETTVSQDIEMRAVWISYLDLNPMFKSGSEAGFTREVGKAFDQITAMGLNTVIVQVRPFGDALYPSRYFPWSHTITGTEGKDPGYDPLGILVKQAKDRGLRFEAWINPYRVRSSGVSTASLSSGNLAKTWAAAGSGDAVTYNGGLYYNPASTKAQSLIVNGVTEIIENYDVDGIHIDDYFYPTTDEAFDADSFMAYREGGGTLSRDDWRRGNVEKLIKKLYDAVKAADPQVRFGVSPQANIQNNYNEQYFDSEKLLASDGYMDYICPQIYFGYQNASYPYEDTVALWNRMIKADNVDLYVGIAAYKLGNTDQWAGTGREEWLDTEDILMRMVEDGRENSHYKGFSIYRYDSLFNPATSVMAQVEAEKSNLKSVLK